MPEPPEPGHDRLRAGPGGTAAGLPQAPAAVSRSRPASRLAVVGEARPVAARLVVALRRTNRAPARKAGAANVFSWRRSIPPGSVRPKLLMGKLFRRRTPAGGPGRIRIVQKHGHAGLSLGGPRSPNLGGSPAGSET